MPVVPKRSGRSWRRCFFLCERYICGTVTVLVFHGNLNGAGGAVLASLFHVGEEVKSKGGGGCV